MLVDAAKKAMDEFGVGSGASRLVCGTLPAHSRLESEIARFKGTEAALTFSSGYAAAVGTIAAMAGKDDVVIMDKLCHASLIDGARLAGAALRVFPHNHLGRLESHLAWARDHHPGARVLVITESVFSMDGDLAPLAEIVDLKDRYGATLLLDEAHAIGVLGVQGRGLAAASGLANRVDVQMGTLSKALGVSGGYICGRRSLIDLLVNRARSFIYSTAPPPSLAAAAAEAISLLSSAAGEDRRRKLWSNIEQFWKGLPRRFAPLTEPASAIVPLMVGPEDIALAASRWLLEKGFFIPAIRFPTVAKGAARLRCTVSATHEPEQIDALCATLAALADKLALHESPDSGGAPAASFENPS